MKAFLTLFKTELKLSLRGMDMVLFAILLPLVALILLGLLYGDKPAFEGAEYGFLEQSFGGLAAISVCAGGAMGLPLAVSDYRSRGILKRFRVTPVHPGLILSAQAAVYALYAIVSLLLLYVAGAAFFGYRMQGALPLFLLAFLLVMLSMFSLGMMVGGIARDAKTASIIASILYFPMLIFSGATLPYEIMPAALQKASDFLPLTQGIKLLKATSLGLPAEGAALPVLVMVVLAAVCIGVSVRFFRWE